MKVEGAEIHSLGAFAIRRSRNGTFVPVHGCIAFDAPASKTRTVPLALPLPHALLALAVVAVWGSNFVVIKHALVHLPPLTLAALRFSFAFLPAALVLPRPAVARANLAAYGVLIGVGQFGVLYFAMRRDISPGLASLVVQAQAFFTIAIAMARAGDRPRLGQGLALALAAAGIVVIARHADRATTPRGLLLTLVAALGWALGNTVSRRAGKVDMIGYVVHSSGYAILPLVLFALLIDGPAEMVRGVREATLTTWGAVLWQSFANTLFGYAAWGWLLSRHSASVVAPLSLLVPVFGISASAWLLHEPLPGWKLASAAMVVGGLALNVLAAPRVRPPAARAV